MNTHLENGDYMVCRTTRNIHNLGVSSPRNYQLLKPPLPIIRSSDAAEAFSNVFNPDCARPGIDPTTSYPGHLGDSITPLSHQLYAVGAARRV